jgi:glycosyltransferase involved in cell wall biosynthesis
MANKNKKTKQVYRIGIDARFFGLENKGLGRYTKELVEQLDKINQKTIISKKQSAFIEYYIFLRNDNFNDYQPQAKNIHKVKADYRWYSWGEQIFFPRLLKKYKLDLMHFTHFNAPIFYRGKFIVTIHDLILFHYPTIKNTTLNKLCYFFKLSVYHLVIRVVAKKAILIIAISRFTKKDIVDSLKVIKGKIKVVYEGAEFTFSQKYIQKNAENQQQIKDTIFKKYGILNKYLLYVGNAYPHKNLERLVLAFETLNIKDKDGLQLVLVGKKDYFYERLEEFISNNNIKNIIITDYISDYELAQLYRRAELFVFPSLYEGFGLPPLEALVRGVPVVSSSKSSLLEILDNKVKYFDPESVQSIKKGIEDALLNRVIELTSEEITKLKNKYNWEKMTRETVEIYKTTSDSLYKQNNN